MDTFIKGLELSELFYRNCVRQILHTCHPKLNYSAGLIGTGSEVLGYDTPISMDHDWGVRLFIFLSDEDWLLYQEDLSNTFRKNLPGEFMGFSTSYGSMGKTRFPEESVSGSVNHMVEIFSVKSFFRMYLDIDPYEKINVFDWLTFEEHKLLTIVKGGIFYDGLNELGAIREQFSFYPKDIWLYLMASQWKRISQEHAFMGRCGHVGDDLGSRIIGTRLVRDLMKLCFQMERQYVPYNKWFGTAFSELRCSDELSPIFTDVLKADDWNEREHYLTKAYTYIGAMHNSLGVTEPVNIEISNYYGRPYKVINADDFVKALLGCVENEELKAIGRPIGSVNQFIDCTDILGDAELCGRVKSLYYARG
jgi:hypothetical protein